MPRNITKKKTEIRFYDVLSNGKLLNIYLDRQPQRSDEGLFQWWIGVCISETRKEANLWYNTSGSKGSKITGDGSMEGMIRAFRYVKEAMHYLGPGEELIIGAEDRRRLRAYRYVERLNCVQGLDANDETIAYMVRNPEYWQWD